MIFYVWPHKKDSIFIIDECPDIMVAGMYKFQNLNYVGMLIVTKRGSVVSSGFSGFPHQ